jgi:hypothetical protein
MSFTPDNAAIRTTPEMEAHLKTLVSAGEIEAYLHAEAEKQGLVQKDACNPSVLIPTALANNAPRKLAKVITINGTKHIIEGADEAEVAANEAALYRHIFAPKNTTQQDQQREANGRFTSPADKQAQEAEAVRLAKVEQDYRAGILSTDDYLLQSGAIDRALTARQQQEQSYAQSWAQSVEQFLASSDWPGGKENMKILGQILAENNLTDAEDKVAALQTAYKHAVENKLLVKTSEQQRLESEAALREKLKNVNDPAQLRAITLQHYGADPNSAGWERNSGMFGR